MLQIHTDPQAESPSNLSGGAAGMSPNVLGSGNMMGMNPGQNSTGTTGMTPMQSSNMALIPLLARNLGYYVVASFLMGTQQAIQWEGILASVGNDYLVIYQPDQNRFVSGDIYSLKFVEFHEDQSPCAGYRRRDAYHGW